MKTLVLFYSTYGHIWKMAEAVAEGARQVSGNEVVVKRVPETLPQAILDQIGATEAQKAFEHIPVATPNELEQYDAIIFGTPTRYGNLCGQMQAFMDSTGGLWAQGKLVGKVGGVFVSTATQHGGQETTIRAFHTELLHHGFVIVGLPYAWQGQMGHETVTGGTPYGASTVAGGQGERQPSENELEGAIFQGRHTAEIASKLAK
ncbi:NAD(P)H:quinone oxidoreductase [Hymenobacter taeanensis]|uniref:NAD(P)H dehydrogenase (quinone) n=1 Tax=Hymenobacter taeanensis TaxID=2735321 RepID=A0A6M6BDZ5_9BACT|nr:MULTISPECIES: NAD(P)H:quinone oxidoreductase [Hymenobacter]QJX46200.1 NAD(P)H:quinone oxidoreductase [Hymenobacter taeanensis]UOQ80056.1 NAD(P)H:quinone oxidoreductase [Hymenobacter sp. 5414T-23]